MAELAQDTELRIKRVLNTIESGTPDGNYSCISIYNDGHNETRQITYGCSQTTEQGNLKDLVKRYISASGKYSQELTPYIDKIGAISLADDKDFIKLLEKAGSDEVMKVVQDSFFDEDYFQPSMDWATANGFILPLSKLVIYDSFVQSGHILMEIRNTFSERPPRNGGDEKLWIIFYLRARLIFLQNSRNPDVRKSVYRVKDYQQAINDNNWNMNNPIVVQGFFV